MRLFAERGLQLSMILDIFKKQNLHVLGNPTAPETLVFAHGYGSDQAAWRFILPAFEERYQLVLFDLVGCGNSDIRAFDPMHYTSLHPYADDLIAICDELKIKQAHLIAHSVSSMIGTLATLKRPDLFSSLIFIGGSPRYLDDEGYVGGFTKKQVGDILLQMANNYSTWLNGFAPTALDAPDKPELANEFASSLARMRPGTSIAIAKRIFSIDCRLDVAQLKLPVLIVQSRNDIIVPSQVGEYLHRVIPNSQLHWISTPGHFPHMTDPTALIPIVTEYLNQVADWVWGDSV